MVPRNSRRDSDPPSPARTVFCFFVFFCEKKEFSPFLPFPRLAPYFTRAFSLLKVFGLEARQEAVYAEVSPLVISVMDGYNACIFAYGQVLPPQRSRTIFMQFAPRGAPSLFPFRNICFNKNPPGHFFSPEPWSQVGVLFPSSPPHGTMPAFTFIARRVGSAFPLLVYFRHFLLELAARLLPRLEQNA